MLIWISLIFFCISILYLLIPSLSLSLSSSSRASGGGGEEGGGGRRRRRRRSMYQHYSALFYSIRRRSIYHHYSALLYPILFYCSYIILLSKFLFSGIYSFTFHSFVLVQLFITTCFLTVLVLAVYFLSFCTFPLIFNIVNLILSISTAICSSIVLCFLLSCCVFAAILLCIL